MGEVSPVHILSNYCARFKGDGSILISMSQLPPVCCMGVKMGLKECSDVSCLLGAYKTAATCWRHGTQKPGALSSMSLQAQRASKDRLVDCSQRRARTHGYNGERTVWGV